MSIDHSFRGTSLWAHPQRRSDGLALTYDRVGKDYAWIIRDTSPLRREPIYTCPCCNKPMHSLVIAQLVAQEVYPLSKGTLP
jgi:hypothetical protein